MTGEHERARQLMMAERVEGITPADRVWLAAHLDSCPACSAEAATLKRAVSGLKTMAVPVDARLSASARLRVRSRAAELQRQRSHLTPIWLAAIVSWAWIVLLTPSLAQGLAWLAGSWSLSGLLLAGLAWWFLPSTIVAAALAWRYRMGSHTASAVRAAGHWN